MLEKNRKQIKSYEDLEVYQESFELAIEIHKITLTFPKHELYELGSQLRRSSKSIPTNIAEGWSKKHTPQYLESLNIAQAELRETKVHLKFSYRLAYITKEKYINLISRYNQVAKKLKNLEKSLILFFLKPKTQNLKPRGNGFTLTEMLVVIAIMVIIISLGIINYRKGQGIIALNNEAERLASVLREARTKAMAGELFNEERPAGFGVYIQDKETYILFADKKIGEGSGDNERAGDSSEDIEEFSLPQKIYFQTGINSTFVFSLPNAKLSDSGSIKLTLEEDLRAKCVNLSPTSKVEISDCEAGEEEEESECGDGTVSGLEVCDGNFQSCTINGYTGIQVCAAGCTGWDVCQPTQWCGDGTKNGLEQCDGEINCDPTTCDWQYLFVFVTTNSYDGNLKSAGGQLSEIHGIPSADKLCQQQAAQIGSILPQGGNYIYKAWLSTETGYEWPTQYSPWARWYKGNNLSSKYQYRLSDKTTIIAESWNDLTDGILGAAINIDSRGRFSTSGVTWTGTGIDGKLNGPNCSGWTAGLNTYSGRYGNPASSTITWTIENFNSLIAVCASPKKLYCFQQP